MIITQIFSYETVAGKKESPGRLVIRLTGGTLGRINAEIQHLNGDFIASVEIEPVDLQNALKAFV